MRTYTRLFLCAYICLLCNSATFSQRIDLFCYTVKDGKTGQPLKDVSYSGKLAMYNTNLGRGGMDGFFGWGNEAPIDGSLGDDGKFTCYIPLEPNWPPDVTFEWTLQFDAPGYNSKSVSNKTTVSRAYFGKTYTGATVTSNLFLEPLVKEVEVNGRLNLNNQQADPVVKEADLGVYEASVIAAKLGVPTSDIIALIDNGELAAKKIGEKYFVAKEEFTRFVEGKDAPKKSKTNEHKTVKETKQQYLSRLADEAEGCLIAEKWDGALGRYNEIHRLSPNDVQGKNGTKLVVDAMVRRADLLMESKRSNEAAELYQKAMQLKPGDKVLASKLAKAEELCRTNPSPIEPEPFKLK